MVSGHPDWFIMPGSTCSLPSPHCNILMCQYYLLSVWFVLLAVLQLVGMACLPYPTSFAVLTPTHRTSPRSCRSLRVEDDPAELIIPKPNDALPPSGQQGQRL